MVGWDRVPWAECYAFVAHLTKTLQHFNVIGSKPILTSVSVHAREAVPRACMCLRFSRLVDIGLLCAPTGLMPSLPESLLPVLCWCYYLLLSINYGKTEANPHFEAKAQTLTSTSADSPDIAPCAIMCLRFSRFVDIGLLHTPAGLAALWWWRGGHDSVIRSSSSVPVYLFMRQPERRQ